jgi:hypothetical protein
MDLSKDYIFDFFQIKSLQSIFSYDLLEHVEDVQVLGVTSGEISADCQD